MIDYWPILSVLGAYVFLCAIVFTFKDYYSSKLNNWRKCVIFATLSALISWLVFANIFIYLVFLVEN